MEKMWKVIDLLPVKLLALLIVGMFATILSSLFAEKRTIDWFIAGHGSVAEIFNFGVLVGVLCGIVLFMCLTGGDAAKSRSNSIKKLATDK